jgi:hypothetical protein
VVAAQVGRGTTLARSAAMRRARHQHVACLCWSLCLLAPSPALGQSQTAAPASPGIFQWSATNVTRVESWSFFEPPPAGGTPDYTFIANRLRLGVTGTWSRIDYGVSVQYVQFGNLPEQATGPGPLGTGALYYLHAGRTDSHGVYLRTLFGRVRLPGNVTVQGGRFPYQLGAESPSGQAKIESVKRARLDGRLIGEFEWSLYQRTFDGIRGDVDRKSWHVSGSWFRPTQGGFEEDAGGRLSGIDITSATVTLRPAAALPATDVGFFAFRYDDDRPVAARPDNTGRSATRVDVAITTFGATAVGATALGNGEADWLGWFAGQTGSWYSQDHGAWSLALEGGYQWKSTWQPWVRAGFLHATGDRSPSDDRHQTFFPVLPTVRKYAFTTAYAPMNLEDAFVELIARPASRLTVRADVRRLWLAEAADLWYSGSGATQQSGSIFGYSGRRSGNTSDFGTAVECAADYSFGRHWSLNGFFGAIHGGPVVSTSFTGDWLRFFYLENVVQF